MDELEILGDRLFSKIDKANTYFLEKIGEIIKSIRDIKPSQAHQLVQMLKYGGKYEEILAELSQYTGYSQEELNKIFSLYAQKDLNFARKFYDYNNIPYTPFNENMALKTQTQALANITNQTLQNFTRSRALGYTLYDINNKPIFTGLRETYEKVLDEALLNVGQGKDTFDNAMSRILKQLGDSGLKTLDYASGRSIRLDSMARMHLGSGIKELHNETQRLLGQEFGADGVEITVHLNPAEDHQEAQGRQFSYEQFNLLQDTGIGKTYQGKMIDMTNNGFHRPISEYNCYHYTFAIVLGVNKPQYSDKQLKQIINDNNKGFEYEGKHYTNYEGTQLQRMLERKVREYKDIQIGAKASDNDLLAGEMQRKITITTNKYKELCQVSGLPSKMDRMKVSNYKRSAVSTKTYEDNIKLMKIGEFDISKYTNEIKPTTNDVILTPKQDIHIQKDHPEVMPWYNKLSDIVNNPDKIYRELGKKNTIWLTKDYDGTNIKVTIRINTSTLYQKKTAGYRNSVIQMQPLPKGRIEKRIKKGEVKELFDVNKKK